MSWRKVWTWRQLITLFSSRDWRMWKLTLVLMMFNTSLIFRLDFILVHTFATNATSNKSGHLLLTSQTFSYLKNDVNNRGGGRKNSKTIQIFVILWLPFIWLGTIGPCTYMRKRWPFTLIQYHDTMIAHQLYNFQRMYEGHGLFLKA